MHPKLAAALAATTAAATATAGATALLLLTPGLATAHTDRGGEVTGTVSTGVFTATIDARQFSSDPHDVRGYVRAHPGPPGTPVLDGLGARGHLTCMRIEGNRVGVIYSIDKGSEPPFIQGGVIYAAAIDNHGHGPDESGFLGGLPGQFPDCTPDLVPMTPVIHGHITVHQTR
jgi:hypothetical protein